MLDVTIRGINKLKRDLKAESRRQNKAMVTAIKVEAFRLRNEMKKEIRKGAPGGQKFAPLSYLARYWSDKPGMRTRMRPNRPLAALARAVHYHVKDGNPLDVRVGFTGPRLSKTWKRIARMHQEGFVHQMDQGKYSADFKRAFLARTGGKLGRRSKTRKYLFIKKSTKTFHTPERPIVEPFWESRRTEALVNIRNNFRRKMRGERI